MNSLKYRTIRKRKDTGEEVEMNVMKFQEIAADPFHCLPDDLLLSILSWLADLKSLCQCSLVSKHFASVIPQIRIVSVVVPSSGDHTGESYRNMCKLLLELRHVHTVEEISDFLESSLQKLKLPKFLAKFRELENIHLEYREPSNNEFFSFPKWKVKCSSSPMIESLVSLLPALICKETGEQIVIESTPDGMWLPIVSSTEWLCIICMLVKTHTSLKRVTIADAKERGKLILRDEQLVNLRSRVPGEELVGYIALRNFHYALIPKVHLPLGCVMRDVFIVIINFPAESRMSATHDDEFGEIMSWDFVDDEKILGEAIKEILKNHRHMIKTFEV